MEGCLCSGRPHSGVLPRGPPEASGRQAEHRVGVQARDELLNLALALMTRGFEHVEMILLCEVRRKESDRGQVETTIGDSLENRWKAPRGPRGFNATVRGVFGEMCTRRS